MKTLLLFLALLAPGCVHAQSAAIAFQGQLADGGRPATGVYDFVFRLFNAATDGTEAGPAVTITGLGVTNGYFTASLDFGLAAYQGGNGRWVQVEVRTGGTAEAFTAILPRTAMTPVPFALYALSAGSVASTNLPATVVHTAQLLATNSALLTAFAADLLTTSNGVSGRLVATNTALVNALANEGLLRTNGLAVLGTELAGVTNGLSARLLATNSALLTALATDLLTTSNGLSGRLVGTNAALAASLAALQTQWLTGSNVVSGSNYYSGALVATNATLTGSFTGNGAGLTNIPPLALSGVLSATQIPPLNASTLTSGTLNPARLDASIARSSELVSATNVLRVQMSDDKAEILTLLTGLGLTNQTGSEAIVALIFNVSNRLSADLVGTNALLVQRIFFLNNSYNGTNSFLGPVYAAHESNQFTGSFTGNGAGLTNVAVGALAGTLTSGQLPATVVHTAQLLATNSALLTAFAADLLTTSNGVSGRLLATNTALVNALANEGLLRTNGLAVLGTELAGVTNGLSARLLATNSALLTALATDLLTTSNGLSGRLVGTNAALAASLAALQTQWLTGSNVVSGSNYYSGALVATNATLTGSFTGNGAGLTNVAVGALAGTLTSGQLPASVVYTTELQATNASLQSAFNMSLLSISNDFSSRLVATNTALVAGAVLGTNYEAAMATLLVAIPNQILSSNNVHVGSNYFSGPATFRPSSEVQVPLVLHSKLNTNSFVAYDVMLGLTRTTNIFEVRSDVDPNVTSFDALARLSLGRGGAPARAMAHFGSSMLSSTTNNAFMLFDSMDPDPQRTGGWALSHALGDNATDPRKNKLWSWGFNYNAKNGKHSITEPSIHMNLETWWEPWPGASDDDHQMEMYYQYSNHNNTFGMRPWGLLLRGSNYIQNTVHVDDFAVGSGDGLRDVIFRVQPRRAPHDGGVARMKGVFEIAAGTPMGGLLYLNNAGMRMGDGVAGNETALLLEYSQGEFQFTGGPTPAPGKGVHHSGFAYQHFSPRYPTNVTVSVFGARSQTANLMEFHSERIGAATPLAAVSATGVVNAQGYRTAAGVGLSTNVAVLAPGGITNTLVFSGGLLVEVRAGPPAAP